MNLRFIYKAGRFVLQQQYHPFDMDAHEQEWRDVKLDNPEDVPKQP